MQFKPLVPPRRFTVGRRADVVLSDCGRLKLQAGEQVTVATPAGAEFDVVRTTWGFYPIPSLNARLPRLGLRPVLVINRQGRWFLLLVARGRQGRFTAYCRHEGLRVVGWLDEAATLEAINDALCKP